MPITAWRLRPLPLLLLALAAAATVVAFSEGAFERATRMLDELEAIGVGHQAGPTAGEVLSPPPDGAAARRDELHDMVRIGRVGVPALGVLMLLALAAQLRRSSRMEKQQGAAQGRVEADNERLELLVVQRTAQLTELAQHLQTAREDERARLARDLHDELGALLTSAKLDIARLRSRLAGTAPEAIERLAHLTLTLDSVIALKRRITEDLRPSSLDHLGLLTTLEILAREFGARSGVKVTLALEPVALDAAAELVAYRLVQEAVTNITKYAQASQVWITLGECAGRVELEVRDDGVGFDPASVSRASYGLVGMRFRVEAAQGYLTVVSAPGKGTRIVMSLPAQTPA